jgi:glycosyltransferase involved in cell wall biosynthesis
MLTTSYPRFPGDYSGVFVHSSCRELVRSGLRVIVAAAHWPGAPANEIREGVEVRRFRYLRPESLQYVTLDNLRWSWRARAGLPSYLIAFWMAARRLARECDLLHAHWLPSGLVGLLALRSRPRVPLVVSAWGSDVALLEWRWARAALRPVLERAQAIIAVSASTRADLIRAGADPDHVKVVRSAASPLAKPSQPREEVRRRLALPEGAVVALYLGRLSPVKRPDLLVQAARLIPRKLPVHFVVAGEGDMRAQLESALRAQGLEDRFHFMGHVAHDDVGTLLAAADLLVLPSASEGLPVAVMEAMAFGLPIVASAVGGVPEIVRDGENGYLFPAGDARMLAARIAALASDPTLRQRLGHANEAILLECGLTWDRVGRDLLRIYSELLPVDASRAPLPAARQP